MINKPRIHKQDASDFRQHQSDAFKVAVGSTLVEILNKRQGSRYLVDPQYFNQLLQDYRSAMSTIEVLSDTNLMAQIQQSAQDMKAGKLYSADEVFDQD